MKILILGHKGYLGSYLYQNLPADVLLDRDVYDNGIKYDYIINCIGKPGVEYCEKHVKETDYSNWLVVEDIIKYYPNSKIINFSTYYVYDQEGLCKETANTTDQYNYMRQNLNAEKIISNGVSFRLGKLFGNKKQDQNKLIDYILKNDDLILDSILFNPTSLNQVLQIIRYELDKKCMTGVFNLSNSGVASPHDWGVFVNELLGLNKHITKIEKMNRIFHNYGRFLMDVSKINKIYPLTDWREDFKKYLLC